MIKNKTINSANYIHCSMCKEKLANKKEFENALCEDTTYNRSYTHNLYCSNCKVDMHFDTEVTFRKWVTIKESSSVYIEGLAYVYEGIPTKAPNLSKLSVETTAKRLGHCVTLEHLDDLEFENEGQEGCVITFGK